MAATASRKGSLNRWNLLQEIEAKAHIEEIRSKKFSIGVKSVPNPLTQDLHRAVTLLSNELYAKDIHFLMELIQNAEDNEYGEGVKPSLEFVLTRKDITESGASATLLVFNNEIGFSKQNMASICSVGNSTKGGKRGQGFIGEKGIGFKSVFLVSKEPHIVSNGYKVKFSEKPDTSCGIGYIVPKWVSDTSFVAKIHEIYGLKKTFPGTTIVLPLKTEKLKPVEEQLSQLHPELLLFLSKIKRLCVRISSSYYKNPADVSSISISHETEPVDMRSKKADSRVVHLSWNNEKGSSESSCRYYIWRQSFPVKTENKVNGREDIKDWSISIAFPFEERLTGEASHSVGIFAFLPTSMVTNFPFIIQADFLLASSRESILLDSKWNLGILKCVPWAFVNAFTHCVEDSPGLLNAAQTFKFLPVKDCPIAELVDVREAIRSMLFDVKIIPRETFNGDLQFCKPSSAVRILDNFRKLLKRIKKRGISLDGLSSLKSYLIDSSLDVGEYDEILDFLHVRSRVDSCSWYAKCVTACELISQASDKDYIDLLCIFAVNQEIFAESFFMENYFFKYTSKGGTVKLCSAKKTKKKGHKIHFAMKAELHSWLSTCNLEFNCPGDIFFFPNSTQAALVGHEWSSVLIGWLSSHAKIESCSAYDYCSSLCKLKNMDKNLLLKFTQFVYHTNMKGFISQTELSVVAKSMPIIDGSNSIRKDRRTTLVCARDSKWAQLFGSRNPLSKYSYHDLGVCYSASDHFAGEFTPENSLLNMLTEHTGALDLPKLCPPNVALEVVCSKLTCEQGFFLLEWIRFLMTQKTYYREKFIQSVRKGKWMKTCSGFSSPSKCILPDEMEMYIFDLTSCVLGDLSVLDRNFYKNNLNLYEEELKYLGVTLGLNDVRKVAMSHFEAAAPSEMSKSQLFSLLAFIRLLKERNILDEEWLKTMKSFTWLKTSQGAAAPTGSFFLSSASDYEVVSRITDIPVIDRNFYCSNLDAYSVELKLLGIKSDDEVFRIILERITFQDVSAFKTNSCGLFILECIRRLQPAVDRLIEKVQKHPWLKTSLGFCRPSFAILPNPNLACLLNSIEVPLVDEAYYGNSIHSYTNELNKLGVAVDVDSTLKIVSEQIQVLTTSSKMSPSNFISLLQGIRGTVNALPLQLDKIVEALADKAFLKTRHGYLTPSRSILSDNSWASISLFVDLPTIDDSHYGLEIYDYQVELELLGVKVGLQEGANFVVKGLTRTIKAGQITGECALSFLKAIRVSMSSAQDHPSLHFLSIIMESEFLRTTHGDRSPKKCILLQSQWKDILEPTDLPFIDEIYYSNRISEYQNELKNIRVKIDVNEVCDLLFASLYSLSETSSVKRFYRFLHKCFWKSGFASDNADSLVWIPDRSSSDKSGKWVGSKDCIVHGRSKYFGNHFHCLDEHYEEDLLPIFSQAFGVLEFPDLHHHMKLWRSWSKEDNCELTLTECESFWDYILANWNSKTKEALKRDLTKLPAESTSLSMRFRLVSKEKLIFPDDLLLKRTFSNTLNNDGFLFVWLPRGKITELHKVFDLLGVKRLSESFQCCVQNSLMFKLTSEAYLRDVLISRGLIKIILSYLASPKMNMGVTFRHEAAKSVLDLSISEGYSYSPVRVSYKLLHPSGSRTLEVESQKLVHWDKSSRVLLIDNVC